MSLAMSPNWPIGSLCAVSSSSGLVLAMVVGNRWTTPATSSRSGDHLILVEGDLERVWSTQIRKLKWLEREMNS